jgi:hypothetical protein
MKKSSATGVHLPIVEFTCALETVDAAFRITLRRLDTGEHIFIDYTQAQFDGCVQNVANADDSNKVTFRGLDRPIIGCCTNCRFTLSTLLDVRY